MGNYAVIIKTADAEIRAIENTSKKVLKQTFPVIEITRGRKITKDQLTLYPFDKRLNKLKEAFKGQRICFDLTSSDALSSDEIKDLYKPNNGYSNWINFLLKIKDENVFQEVIPTIILDIEDIDFEENLILQVKSIKDNFQSVLYRNVITDENCYDDFELLKDHLEGLQLYVMVDCEYTPQASHQNVASKCIARIDNLQKLLSSSTKYIICATSFPNNVKDVGNADADTFSISEINIFDAIVEKIPNIIYGDYASINPIRNDTVIMARGWIPKIDTPLETFIYYYRQRRPQGISAYSSTYIQVAQLVVNDDRFPKDLDDNWGINQITTAANGGAPSASPSFWISVRMNIHIAQQVKRISKKMAMQKLIE